MISRFYFLRDNSYMMSKQSLMPSYYRCNKLWFLKSNLIEKNSSRSGFYEIWLSVTYCRFLHTAYQNDHILEITKCYIFKSSDIQNLFPVLLLHFDIKKYTYIVTNSLNFVFIHSHDVHTFTWIAIYSYILIKTEYY